MKHKLKMAALGAISFFLVFVIAACIFASASGNNVLLILCEYNDNKMKNILCEYPEIKNRTNEAVNGRVYPMMEFNFDEGAWEAYLDIGIGERKYLNRDIAKIGSRLMKTEDVEILKALQKLPFVVMGTDYGTPVSGLTILKSGKIVYDTALYLDSDVGLQGAEYGYIVPEDKQKLIDIFARFDRVYSPIVIIW